MTIEWYLEMIKVKPLGKKLFLLSGKMGSHTAP